MNNTIKIYGANNPDHKIELYRFASSFYARLVSNDCFNMVYVDSIDNRGNGSYIEAMQFINKYQRGE